jgi:hypothetical protein
MNESDIIPCTGCDYCADCPKEVKISRIFAAYNKYKTDEIDLDAAKAEYQAIDVKADECIACGQCKNHCPQSIDIPDWMQTGIPKIFG